MTLFREKFLYTGHLPRHTLTTDALETQHSPTNIPPTVLVLPRGWSIQLKEGVQIPNLYKPGPTMQGLSFILLFQQNPRRSTPETSRSSTPPFSNLEDKSLRPKGESEVGKENLGPWLSY